MDRKCRTIGILATERVVRSKIYTEELEKLNPSVEIFYQACPLLVPIIEAGGQDEQQSDAVVSEYLGSLFAQESTIDTILLACTHYPILYEAFRRHTPSHVNILTQGSIVARKLRDYLDRHPEIGERLSREGTPVVFFHRFHGEIQSACQRILRRMHTIDAGNPWFF